MHMHPNRTHKPADSWLHLRSRSPPARPLPPVTPLIFPADDLRSASQQDFHPDTPQSRSRPIPMAHDSSLESSLGPPTPPDAAFETLSLDDVWASVRRQKEQQLAKSPPKVNLAAQVVQMDHDVPDDDAEPEALPQPKRAARRRKSRVELRESSDGAWMTAVFDMSNVHKDDMHVSFRGNELEVRWRTLAITEYEDGDVLVRERREKTYCRTLPLPEGTKFSEVHAAKDARRLTLTFPNLRAIRVEPR